MKTFKKKVYRNNRGATFLVLPKWWIDMNSLKNGDEILMKVETLNRIVIELPEDGNVDSGCGNIGEERCRKILEGE